MKKVYIIVSILLLTQSPLLMAQSLQRSVISSLGTQVAQLGFTIGQPVSGESEDTSFYGLLGYQHPLKFPLDTSINAPSVVNVCGKSFRLEAGQAPYYQWYKDNIAITGAVLKHLVVKETGSYRVQFSDGKTQFVNSRAIRVFFREPPVAEIIPAETVTICSGTKVLLKAKRISGCTYQWNKSRQPIAGATGPDFAVTEAGNYSVTVTSQFGCTTNSANVLVKVNGVPVVNITSSSAQGICPGGSVTLRTVNNGGYTYLWKHNNIPVNGATSYAHTAIKPGTYTAEVTTSTGCKVISPPYQLVAGANCGIKVKAANVEAGMRKMDDNDDPPATKINVYPNPISSGQLLNVQRSGLPNEILRYSITDISGRVVKSGTLSRDERHINWNAVAGIYQLIIIDSNNKRHIFRIVRN